MVKRLSLPLYLLEYILRETVFRTDAFIMCLFINMLIIPG